MPIPRTDAFWKVAISRVLWLVGCADFVRGAGDARRYRRRTRRGFQCDPSSIGTEGLRFSGEPVNADGLLDSIGGAGRVVVPGAGSGQNGESNDGESHPSNLRICVRRV